MELYLIRHGQSTNNENKLARMADPPLTDLGQQQAYRAGKALEREGITRLYCSPMHRALQTAQIIGELLSLVPHVFVGLHEWDGVWEKHDEEYRQLPGLTGPEMKEICPDVVLPDDVTKNGWWFGQWRGIGPMLQLADRDARAFISHLQENHPREDDRIAAVSHGGFLSTLIGTFFGLPPNDDSDRFAHHNAAISKIRYIPPRTQLRYLHRVSHLATEMITW